MARVIARVTHSQCTGLPLQADLKERVFKLLFLDIGLMNLMNAVCGLGWHTIAGLKAGRTGTLKSLHQFVAEKRASFAVRFDADLPALHTVEADVRRGHGSERIRYTLLSLPLYLVERLPRMVEALSTILGSPPPSVAALNGP